MFWLTVRQHRTQLIITVALLAAFGAVLLVHGIGTSTAAVGLTGAAREDLLADRHFVLGQVIDWFPLLPLLAGLFWGAPVLAREFEHGTHRLAWTQGVSRGRWLLAKLAVLGAVVTLAGLALGAMVTAWTATFNGTPFGYRFANPTVFATTGVAAGAWWLFAFVCGVAGGAVLPRILPAMAVTVPVFILVMVGVFTSRADYAEPARVVGGGGPETLAVDSMAAGGAWLAPSGKEIAQLPDSLCPDRARFYDCASASGYRLVSYVHPADRYWRFQWIEAGVLVAAAALLGGVTYLRVVRRSA